MAKTKISEFSTTPGNNTDINGINIAEGCAPSGINNAIRELMSDLKEWQSGAMDVYVIPQGTAAAPGIQLYGDLDTGLYGYAANQLGVAVGGASAGYFSSAGWVGNVNGTITGDINATTIDTTNIEVTNIKAKDGTAAITIADSTGVVSVSTQLAVDNLNLSGNTLSSSDTNGNIILAPNGTGDVYLDADTIRVGDSNTNVTITSNGTADLILNTNSGTNSGSITIQDGVNGNILIATNGTGQIQLTGDLDVANIETGAIKARDGTASATIANSTGVMTIASSVLTTTDINGGTIDGTTIGGSTAAAGTFTTATATTGNITTVNATTVDTTNIEVTNIKAKDGTAAATIADSTGAITVSTLLNVDNLRLDGNTLSSTDTNGNVVIAPNGTGDVQLDADTVRVGDSNANATITTNGTGDLILNTNAGTNSGSITIEDGVNGNIIIAPNGTGQVQITNASLDLTTIEVSNINAKDGTAAITIADSTGAVGISTAVTMSATTQNIALGTSQTTGTFTVGGAAQTGTQTFDQSTKTHTLNLGTGATESGLTKTINIGTAGVSGSTTTITIGSTNGTTTTLNGTVTAATFNSTTIDTTNIEVTNIKAKDGTAALSIADSTGAVTVATAFAANGGVTLGDASGDAFTINSSAVSIPNGLNFDSDTFVIDAANNRVGIGTNSPAGKLDVFTSSGGDVFIRSNNSALRLVSTGGENYIQSGTATSGSSPADLVFTNVGGTSERMRLTASGNLGLGVTPSAWNSNRKAIQSGNASFFSAPSAASYSAVGANVFNNTGGTDTYIGSAAASLYLQNAGAHSWYTAPSGTAGNAISFTQALTLDANQNLLLNGTSAGASAVGTFAIFNGTAPTGSVTNGVILYAEDVSSSSELKVRDEAGNVTTLSPHNFSLIPEGPSEDMAWAYYSEKGGKRINVDMLKLARMVEKLTGEKLVYKS